MSKIFCFLSILNILFLGQEIFAFSGGDGSPGAPYQVASKSDLDAVDDDPTAYYILISDIDLDPESSRWRNLHHRDHFC